MTYQFSRLQTPFELLEFELRRHIMMVAKPGDAFQAFSALMAKHGHAACRLMDIASMGPGSVFKFSDTGTAEGWWDHYLGNGFGFIDPIFQTNRGDLLGEDECQSLAARQDIRPWESGDLILNEARYFGIKDFVSLSRHFEDGSHFIVALGLSHAFLTFNMREQIMLTKTLELLMIKEHDMSVVRRSLGRGRRTHQ